MPSGSRTFFRALLTMIGTIIGAGVFGLPAAFAIVGFWPGTALFAFLTLVVALSHALYVAVILRMDGNMRLAGYVRKGLGDTAFAISSVTYPMQIIGANVAYIILGGEFLALLAAAAGIKIPLSIWQFLFWIIGIAIVVYGLKIIAVIESYATAVLLGAMLLAVGLASANLDFGPLLESGMWLGLLLPFGVFLFSLAGLSVIAEVVELNKRKRLDSYGSVILGTLAAAGFSYVFGASLYLASHGYPVRTAADLISLLPSAWAWVVPLMGLLAVITSYITSAEDLRASLSRDFKLAPRMALVVALLTPFVIYAFTTRDFVSVIGFVGAVFTGVNYVFVCLLGWKLASGIKIVWRRLAYSTACVLLMSVFAFGIIQKLFSRVSL